MHTEVLVVGAGPAGSTLARILADSGREVTLIDKETFPRHKTCGGGVPLRTRSIIDLDYQDLVERTITHTTLQGGLGRRLTVSNGPVADVVDRLTFDQRLLNAATESGCQSQLGVELRHLEQHKDGYLVETTKGSIHCRTLCACDGANSRTARFLDAPITAKGIALEGYIPYGDSDDNSPSSQTAVFDFVCEQYGYGWVFPRKEELAIGIGTSRWPAADLRQRFDRFSKRLTKSDPILPQRVTGAPLPFYESSRTWYCRNHAYLVGDAAGLVDPLTGEGLFYAIRSGQLAAEAILQGNADLYDRSIRSELCSELNVAAYFAHRRTQIPAWLLGLGLCFGRAKRYAHSFVKLLSGECSYRSLYQQMHRGKSYV